MLVIRMRWDFKMMRSIVPPQQHLPRLGLPRVRQFAVVRKEQLSYVQEAAVYEAQL